MADRRYLTDFEDNVWRNRCKRYSLDDHRRYCELHNVKVIDPYAILAKRRTPADIESARNYTRYVLSLGEDASKAKAEQGRGGGGLERPAVDSQASSLRSKP
uniref:uncharacterized protein LOC122606258 n=1 Tax=Erigeron canadensis TaxID=72917 RepID=UPI001CB941FD|nr:uncharacterized protein LOC122606258 [Erigeron canadensis]